MTGTRGGAVGVDAALPERMRRLARWQRYVLGAGLVVLGSLLGAVVHPLFSPTNLVMIYLLTVVVAAILLGRGPSTLAAVLGVLAFDFFFVPPRGTLTVADTEYLLTFGALLVVSLVISDLTVRLHGAAEAALQREQQTAELYSLSRDMTVLAEPGAILESAVGHVSRTLGCQATILLPSQSEGGLEVRAISPGPAPTPHDLVAAEQVHRSGLPRTDEERCSPHTRMRFLPLCTAGATLGVLGVRLSEPFGTFDREQLDLLEAYAGLTALAVERMRLTEQARQAELLRAVERLQTALLSSITHDLRTPLVSITGVLSTLSDDDMELDPATRRTLVDNAREQAEGLNRFVGNLVDMTRIEAGALRIVRTPCDVEDVVGVVLNALDERLKGRSVIVDVPADLPLVPMDDVLVEQLLMNLLDNALKYSPKGSPLEVSARLEAGEVLIEVSDRGWGIPTHDLDRVFDRLYRVPRRGGAGGMGLGLSICRGIAEAHSGRIWAAHREGGGTTLALALPLPPSTHAP